MTTPGHESAQRIAVLGTGANGASIAADLSRNGVDVTLIEQWPEHVRAMRAQGIRIDMPEQTITEDVTVLDLCDVCTLTEPFDIVLMAMKAYDSPWAARLVEPYLKPDGVLVGVQNGMSHDAIASAVGPARAVACVIEVSSTLREPGRVERYTPPERSWFAVGPVGDQDPARLDQVRALLSHSGRVEAVDDILATKWMKLVSNATTLASTAIVGLPMLDAIALPGLREIMLQAGNEALQAGGWLGHPVLPLFGLTAEDLSREDEIVETLLDILYDNFVLPGAVTTVLQDWWNGRRSEVHDINGRVVQVHADRGLDAPANAAILSVAKDIEAGRLQPDPDNLALLVERLG